MHQTKHAAKQSKGVKQREETARVIAVCGKGQALDDIAHCNAQQQRGQQAANEEQNVP